MLEHQLHATVVRDDDLRRRRGRLDPIADRDERDEPCDLLPAWVERLDRQRDQRIDTAIGEPQSERDLARRIAVGIGDQELVVDRAQLALDVGDELLGVEVGEARHEHADAVRLAAAQRTGDRVGAEAQLVGRGTHAGLGLARHLDASQRIRDGRRREARVRGELLDRRPLGPLLGPRRNLSARAVLTRERFAL